MEIQYLYLDLNSFFASCEQQENPALRGKAVAVVPMLAESTSVLAASYVAKAFGIKTGTSVRDARKMCPGIQFVTSSHSVYVKYHNAVIEACDKVLPIHSVCSIDEVCFELTGSHAQVEKAQILAQKMKDQIRQSVGICMTSSIGIGPNMLISKMAADMQKPDGLTLVKKSELPHRLHSLKLTDVPGIGRQMEYRLHQKGIRTMEQMLKLSEQEMRAVWGSLIGARYYRLLRGDSFEVHRSSQKSIGHSHVLPPKERSISEGMIVGQRLLSKAMVRLRKAKMMTRSFCFSMKFMSGEKFEIQCKVPETQDTSLLIQKIYKHPRPSEQLGRPIKVSVTLADFVPENQHQLSFFENEKKNQLFQTVDRINEKHGRDTIFVGSLLNHMSVAQTKIAFSRIPELEEF